MTATPRLNYVGMAAAVLGNTVRDYAAHQAELERLTVTLAAVAGTAAGGDGSKAASAEAERRAALFAQTWRTSPHPGSHPDIAALQSVIDDITAGRWVL